MTGAAMVAGIAGHVMGDEDAVSGFDVGHEFSGLDNDPGRFVAQHQRRTLDAVPLQKVGPAETAGHDLDHDIAVAGFGLGTLFHPDIAVL